jgi:membrane-bound serine protease (ClpP class)
MRNELFLSRRAWLPARVLGVLRWVTAVLLLVAALTPAAGQNAGAPVELPAAAPGAGAGLGQPVHNKAALIKLSGDVDDMMRRSLERRIDMARKAGVTLIVFQVDTYGGLLTAGLEMDKIIKGLPGEKIRTVAWVNDKAFSAGALISTGCQQIVMTTSGRMGDAAPIQIDLDDKIIPMIAAERAKANSPLLQELEDSARQFGYDKTLLWAMVVPELEVHEVRNATTGETRFVDEEGKTKLLAEELAAPGGEKERPWKFIQTVDGKNQLLTISAFDAQRMGISKATLNNEAELRAALNIRGELMALNATWGEVWTLEISKWLSQGWVKFALFVAMMVLGVVELTHPGASLPGILSLICLVLLIGGPFLTGLAQVWEITLIIIGVALIVTDVAAFGGIGFLAIPGFILAAFGLIASFIPMEPGRWIPTLPGTANALWQGLAVVVFGSAAAIGVLAFLSRYISLTPGLRRIQLATPGGEVLEGPVVHDATDRPANDAVFAGAMGLAVTDLRPAGKVRFDEHLVDVVSYGSFISKGTEVEVVSVEGYRVVVRPRRTGDGGAGGASGGVT